VSAASATNMLKKLDAMALVSHSPYRGALLTDAGRKVALEVIRHHRLLETYLAEALGVPWHQVHKEAEVLEHVLSEDLEDRIASLLGDPAFDPHGHPIPAKDGSVPSAGGRPLWSVTDGEQVSVHRVSDEEADVLRYLDEIGMRPGASVEVVGKGPVSGPLFVRVEGNSESNALSRELAEAIWVQ
jgi:DtxR family transcriptional regulator, Mn-dependent transcriptional regulator